MPQIVAATSNPGKLREICQILAPLGLSVLTPADVGGLTDVTEDGETFAENAVKKVISAVADCGLPALADDSGLEVLALGGAPGVRSARYAGVGATDADRMAKLLAEMPGGEDRRARFVCVVAVATPTQLLGTAVGEVGGQIIAAPRGANGFGYDPLFVPDGFTETFAELPNSVKNGLSHRAGALRAAVADGLFRYLE